MRKLKQGEAVDINEKDECGQTPLHLALKHLYREDIIKFLLEKGADPNVTNDEGQTPLMSAAKERFLMEGAMGLLSSSKKANLNLQDDDGKTALMLAAEGDEKEMMKTLLKKGADANLQDNEGNTALALFIRLRYSYSLDPKPTLKALLSKTDLKLKDKDGYHPLHLVLDSVVRN